MLPYFIAAGIFAFPAGYAVVQNFFLLQTRYI